MAATVNITSYHGAAGGTTSSVDGGSVRYKQADNDTVDANNPIPIPAAGTNYSYIKQFRFNAATTPANTINNLKVYSDGANGLGTGVDLLVKTSATYTDPVANAAAQLASTSTVFGYTSGSPLAVTGSVSNPTTGAFGDYIQSQMSVTTTAAQGNSGSETITFSYDES
jgi:hypothetical protein